jgi:uncharacterized protein (DUF1499 family)
MWIFAACGAPPPDSLGVRDGALAACPETPNCVHTGLRHPEGTQPLLLIEDGTEAELLERVHAVVEGMPRLVVVTRSGRYLHAEERSRVLRFVDDVELLLDDDRELIVRSASRLGSSDFGVNAQRVERLRSDLAEAGLLR